MKIAIVAGEASGDLLGAGLIEALRRSDPHLQVEGVGGPLMRAAGCHTLFDGEVLAVMGLIEPLFHLPQLLKLRRNLYRHLKQSPPDIFIGIDAPEFNLGLELKLRSSDIKIVHYVSPSVWAWRQNRIRKIAKAVDLMLTLFPFEAKFYEQHQVPVHYVGHPLALQIPLKPNKVAARHALGLDQETTYIALLPGSRAQEIHYMAAPFLLAAKMLWEQNPHLRFLTALVNEKCSQAFFAAQQQYAPQLPLQFFNGLAHDVMTAADMAMVTSGTASLEVMLHKKPMIIAYKMSALAYPLARRLVKTPFIGLPNLLANELLVPELIQAALTPENIVKHLMDYINRPSEVLALEEKFTQLHQELYRNTSEEIAEAVFAIAKP